MVYINKAKIGGYLYQRSEKEEDVKDLLIKGIKIQDSSTHFKIALLVSEKSNLTYWAKKNESDEKNSKFEQDEDMIYLYSLKRETRPTLAKAAKIVFEKILAEGYQGYCNVIYDEKTYAKIKSEEKAAGMFELSCWTSILDDNDDNPSFKPEEHKLIDFDFKFPADYSNRGGTKGQSELERLKDRLTFLQELTPENLRKLDTVYTVLHGDSGYKLEAFFQDMIKLIME